MKAKDEKVIQTLGIVGIIFLILGISGVEIPIIGALLANYYVMLFSGIFAFIYGVMLLWNGVISGLLK